MRNSSRRILALTLGNDDLASSRVRTTAALKAIQTRGWQPTRIRATSPTWPAQFLASLIFTRPAVTVVQKVVPPTWYSKIVASLSMRLVFECDDAIHLGYSQDQDEALDISRRLRVLLPLCDCVVVSNSVLRDDLQELGARETVIFPGPAPNVSANRDSEPHRVLWLGSPSTLDNVQSIVYPAFELLPPTYELVVVGASQDSRLGRVAEHPWSRDLQAEALADASIGVAPQAQDEWSLRKAFYKVLEYLAANVVPVVPDQPAIRTLLGAELDLVAVSTRDDTPEAWAAAILQASHVPVDEQWIKARDLIFERWSVDRLGQVMLG